MLPNVIIIGAQKAGTTSLHYYLGLHPEITMSREKELNFFIPQRNWPRGLGWYERHFRGDTPVLGEASPNYTNHPLYAGSPELMHKVVPRAKLIYILRDPVERIVSHYMHAFSDRREDLPLNEALRDPETNRFVWRSRYHFQLQMYLKHFPISQILIPTLEELRRDRRGVMRKIFRFLEVDATFDSAGFDRVRHESADKRRKNLAGLWLQRASASRAARMVPSEVRRQIGKIAYLPFSEPMSRPVLDDETRARLVDVLTPDTEKLRALTGQRFPDWSV